jgi:light-independent protochlorophyllide reductase subunit B
MMVGASCTAELIQDDPGGLAEALDLPVPVVALELPAYQRKENWGAAETFYQLVRAWPGPARRYRRAPPASAPALQHAGPTALGFRHRDDLREITRLLDAWASTSTWCAAGRHAGRPGAPGRRRLQRRAVPRDGLQAAQWLQRTFGQPMRTTVPIGVAPRASSSAEVAQLAGVDPSRCWPIAGGCALRWYARSVDSTYLTGKRVFVFGDATHAMAAARVASQEMGFTVVGLGTYSREFAREVREAAKLYGVEPLITDDYLEVEARIAELQPELVLGTQMERHIAKRLGMPCAVISAPRCTCRTSRRATRRRWASKAPTCCSTPGCTR